MISVRTVISFFCAILLVGLAVGCLKPIKDCLDIRATNFRADADENCCCTWPMLELSVSHQMSELVHSPQDTYANIFGQSYRLLNAVVILSDFQLHFADGAIVTVFDSLLLIKEDGTSLRITNDIIVVDRDKSSITIGSFLASGQLDSISFLVGLPGQISTWSPDYFPENHPLQTTVKDLWDVTTGYTTVQTEHLPIPGMDTIRWTTNLSNRVTLPSDQYISIGSSFKLGLKIDYSQWFYNQLVSDLVFQPDLNWPSHISTSFK